MPPEIQNSQQSKASFLSPLTTVTPFSKYFALTLFVVIPLVTLYVGMQLAPIHYVEVETMVYQETPTVDSAATVNPHTLTASGTTLRAEVYTDESTNPKSNIYVGDFLVLKAWGNCNVEKHIPSDLFTSRPLLNSLIVDESTIVEKGSCWFGGGGSEFYTVRNDNAVQLIGFTSSECGHLSTSECYPFGEPQVLYEIDSTGAVTRTYEGGLFGG